MRSTEYVANNIGISGFKYVLGPHVSRIRRLVWLLVILLASAWMIWNIQDRVTYFLSRPSAITTEMKFKDKLIFPKVTICNQNTFRSSKVYNETIGPRTSASLYEAIDRYLQVLKDDTGQQSAREKVSEKYGELLSDQNIKDFYRRVAHQRNTLINRCMWRGRQCGPKNFTEVFTNMGVCYQFNTSTDMTVDKADADGGLELILFVEQYDYMRDPQSSAGALVVIADQNETEVLAKKQGIGITVGQSVSIGLHKSEVLELPHPYGSCGSAKLNNYPNNVPYTYQKCQLNCLTTFIKKKCGCVSVYMPGEDVPYCTLLENMQCVRPNEELFYRSNEIRTCDCPTPCHSASYMTYLSLVQFSESFKQNLALSNSLVPITTVDTALKIQAWGLINRFNSSITESLVNLGLMLLDYKTRWNRLSSIIHSLLEEVQYLKDFVSEHNLTNYVMAELKPDQKASKTRRDLVLAMFRIKWSFDDSDKQISKIIKLDVDTLDYTMAVIGLYNSSKANRSWLKLIFTYVDDAVKIYMNYHKILFSFSYIATVQIQNLNISEIKYSVITGSVSTVPRNGSMTTRDYNDLVSEMGTFNKVVKERSKTVAIQNRPEMKKILNVWKPPEPYLNPDFYGENLVKLEIYFKDFGVQESKKSPAYSTEGLLCDIGGSIGLCLGGSILTLVEFFDILAILYGNRKKLIVDSETEGKKNWKLERRLR